MVRISIYDRRIKRCGGTASIGVVGPVPVWENNLPKQVFLYCKANTPCEVPKYLKMSLIADIFDLDEAMRQFSGRQNVKYLSPIRVLCKGGPRM
nr:hypothetical protein [Polynucleobacter necessarius]